MTLLNNWTYSKGNQRIQLLLRVSLSLTASNVSASEWVSSLIQQQLSISQYQWSSTWRPEYADLKRQEPGTCALIFTSESWTPSYIYVSKACTQQISSWSYSCSFTLIFKQQSKMIFTDLTALIKVHFVNPFSLLIEFDICTLIAWVGSSLERYWGYSQNL